MSPPVAQGVTAPKTRGMVAILDGSSHSPAHFPSPSYSRSYIIINKQAYKRRMNGRIKSGRRRGGKTRKGKRFYSSSLLIVAEGEGDTMEEKHSECLKGPI